jgi:hypothetical protein
VLLSLRSLPPVDVCLQPGHRVFTQLPALRELTGELEAVNGHARESGGLHYLSYPKKFHEIRPGRFAQFSHRACAPLTLDGNIIRRISGKSHPEYWGDFGPKLTKVWLREQPEMSSLRRKRKKPGVDLVTATVFLSLRFKQAWAAMDAHG